MKITLEPKNSNQALLLLAFYDLINDVEVEDSIVMWDSIAWMIDEIGDRLPKIVEFLIDQDPKALSDSMCELARIYKEHHERRK
jgi:hypothetical protein